MRVFICDGCGKEIMPDEKVYPQGRENYCMECLPHYEEFREAMRPEWEKIDALKREKEKAVRKKIFGEPKPDVTGATYRREKGDDAKAALATGVS